MRWPWRTKDTTGDEVKVDIAEAVDARRRAEEALERAQDRTEEIRQETEKSRWHLKDNHFAQLIIETFREGR